MRRWRTVMWGVGVGLPALHAWACDLASGGFGAVDADAAVDATSVVPNDAGSADVALDAANDVAVGDAASSDGSAADASADERCRQVCQRGVCQGGTCTIECSSDAPCGENICPAGVPCKLHCQGQSACEDIACTNCEIRCDGPQACKNAISCNAPGCAILCCGPQACTGNMECTGAGCGIVCDPSNSGCSNTPSCENGLPSCDAGRKC